MGAKCEVLTAQRPFIGLGCLSIRCLFEGHCLFADRFGFSFCTVLFLGFCFTELFGWGVGRQNKNVLMKMLSQKTWLTERFSFYGKG